MSTYIIGGGTSGIGKTVALDLLEQGNAVVVFGKGKTHVDSFQKEVADHYKTKCVVYCGDLVDRQYVDSVVSTLKSQSIEGLVNAAGTISGEGIYEEKPETFEYVLSQNLVSAFNLTQSALLNLSMSGASIVNISSVCSLVPCTSLSYSVSKAGMDMFTKSLAKTLASDNIRVNSVNPSVVETNLQKSAGLFQETDYQQWLEEVAPAHPLGRVGTPQDICEAIKFLLDPEKSGWITGAILSIDGGRSVA